MPDPVFTATDSCIDGSSTPHHLGEGDAKFSIGALPRPLAAAPVDGRASEVLFEKYGDVTNLATEPILEGTPSESVVTGPASGDIDAEETSIVPPEPRRSIPPQLVFNAAGEQVFAMPELPLFEGTGLRYPDVEPKLGDKAYLYVESLLAKAGAAKSVKGAYEVTNLFAPRRTGSRGHRVPVDSSNPDDLGMTLELLAMSARPYFTLEGWQPVAFDSAAREAAGHTPFEHYVDYFSLDSRIRAVLIRRLAQMYIELSKPVFEPAV